MIILKKSKHKEPSELEYRDPFTTRRERKAFVKSVERTVKEGGTKYKATTLGYGQIESPGSYGNGAIYVNKEDVIPLDQRTKMTEEEIYELRKIELGGEELAYSVWGDFCDWYGERLMIYWFHSSQWWDEINQLWQERVQTLVNQLFGGTRTLRIDGRSRHE